MERIKAYFEEQIKTDPALAEAYKEEKMDKCWKYITSQAKSQAKNGCAMIEDAQVYKWARDFMLGDVPEAKEEIQTGAPAEDNNSVTSEIETIEEGTAEEINAEEPEEVAEKEPVINGKKIADGIYEITPDVHFDSTNHCKGCGYYIGETLDSGKCSCKQNETKSSNMACSDFIKAATDEDIKSIKKLQIEKVEEEPAEVMQPVIQKEKKSKKADEYDGPSLFDFDDLF